ncbi:hypothetical protein [Asanoa siamensis]|uniref:Uncharacterized protein n=1 Tax=Asanoa siamensis TaxID=926357 RepID=A0ABQ4CKX8_9ACTN|nr:hypothetical protein [Asanoa siamensis]GIF71921.1 hypothetical protein Asi02nite_14390 [Asanoa siamensis]
MSTVLPPDAQSSQTPDNIPDAVAYLRRMAPLGSKVTQDAIDAFLVPHPDWCSREGCQMPTGEMFHTRDVAEMDLADADSLNEPVSTWLAVEQTEGDTRAPARVRFQLRASASHKFERGLHLTPGQAVELGLYLIKAGHLAA